MMTQVCLQFVIVIYPEHTHYFCMRKFDLSKNVAARVFPIETIQIENTACLKFEVCFKHYSNVLANVTQYLDIVINLGHYILQYTVRNF